VVINDEVHGKILPADVLAMIHQKMTAHEQVGTE
jgi:hypothetical protein